MNSSKTKCSTFIRRSSILLTASVALGTIAILPNSLPASAAPQQSAAVITPLLNLFEFGDTVGLPEGCQTALTTVSAIVAQANASGQFSPLANQIFAQCNNISNTGSTYIQQGMTASESASALNALLDPVISSGSNSLTTLGNEPGVQDSPFGPTIAGTGQTLSFFEGS